MNLSPRPWFLASALAACGPSPCPEGSVRAATGLCTLPLAGGDTSAPGGPGPGADGADGTSDTGTPPDWTALPASCASPGAPGHTPVTLVGELDVQRHAFVEFVDLAVDPARGLALGTGQGGLVITDISDPVRPRFVTAAWPDAGPQRFYRVALGPDHHVYTTHRDTGLVAWDTADPERPAVTHTIEAADLSGMAVDGGLLYVVTHGGQLITYDLSDPATPVEIHRADGLANGWQPTVVGDWLYVADNTAGVVVYSLADRRAPAFTRAVAAAGNPELAASADGSGSTRPWAGGGRGLPPVQPRAYLRRAPVLHTSAISVDVAGDTLWAATQQDVVALDVSDAAAPRLVGTFQTRQWAMHVAATADDGAWVGDWGWIESYAADKDLVVPDAEPSVDDLFVDEAGDVTELRVANLGGGDLVLEGLTVADPRVTAEVSRVEVPTGESSRVRLTHSGGGALDTELCLQTNDPDEPLLGLRLRDAPSGIDRDYLGTPAPDFDLEDLDGTLRRLSDQRGTPWSWYFATVTGLPVRGLGHRTQHLAALPRRGRGRLGHRLPGAPRRSSASWTSTASPSPSCSTRRDG